MKPDRSYHHGDLRTALIEAGLSLLSERAADDLGLREVARKVGVSATAVYRHFPDKRALMQALAAEGLVRLAAAQRVASETAGGGTNGFAASGAAYIRFAQDNPAIFRLIFASAAPQRIDDMPGEAMLLLREHAAEFAAASGGDAEVVALKAWAIAHGLAMLILDGQVPADDELINRVIHAAPDKPASGAEHLPKAAADSHGLANTSHPSVSARDD